jgi:hypothetical protein
MAWQSEKCPQVLPVECELFFWSFMKLESVLDEKYFMPKSNIGCFLDDLFHNNVYLKQYWLFDTRSDK